MFKVIVKCQKCKEETPAYDDGNGILIIDFEKNLLMFSCPKCGNENIMNFAVIQKELQQRTRLPSIGASRT